MKTLKLYKNEIFKASRKVFFIILVALTALGVFVSSGFIKLIQVISENDVIQTFFDDEDEENDYIEWIQETKNAIKEKSELT